MIFSKSNERVYYTNMNIQLLQSEDAHLFHIHRLPRSNEIAEKFDLSRMFNSHPPKLFVLGTCSSEEEFLGMAGFLW
jgi:hypothetical protein